MLSILRSTSSSWFLSASMSPTAIEHAKLWLGRAESFASQLREANSYSDAEPIWVYFLVAHAIIYQKLEKGARTDPRSRQWYFSTVEKLRRTDPLLSYVKQARNAVEHGLEETHTVEGRAGPFPITRPDGTTVYFDLVWEPAQADMLPAPMRVVDESGNTVWEEAVQKSAIRLARVTNDQFPGDSWDVPNEHLGRPLDPSPSAIAHLALAHAADTIAEAFKFLNTP